ncbi:MAG TPA: hypothetical protein VGD56_14525 [Gemmatirosa sp.]
MVIARPGLLRHPLVRAFLALLAFVATAAPAAAAVGEGVLAARAGRSPIAVHIEDARQAQCPYVHADDCALCAVLAMHARAPTAGWTASVAPAAPRPVPALPEAATWPAQGSLATRHARGPPTG